MSEIHSSSSSPPTSPFTSSTPSSCCSPIDVFGPIDSVDSRDIDSFSLDLPLLLSNETFGTSSKNPSPEKLVRFSSDVSVGSLSTSPIHPFSGAAKSGDRHPPRYQLKHEPVTPPVSPPRRPARIPTQAPTTIKTLPPSTRVPLVRRDFELQIWEKAISRAIDMAEGSVDLSDHNLSYIPAAIQDLAHLVTLPAKTPTPPPAKRAFSRISTAPARIDNPTNSMRVLVRGRTAASLTFGQSHGQSKGAKNEIQLYLAKNFIRSLPLQLFKLANLVVLSLRGNSLTEIPSSISSLRSLRELNVANNQLQFLPPEINDLDLTSLSLHPNPFHPEPICNGNGRTLSPLTTVDGPIPTLVELTLRRLIRPCDLNSSRPLIEEYYVLPLPDPAVLGLREELMDVLAQVMPSTNSCTRKLQPPLYAVCPSPNHADESTPLFHQHIVEKLEWLDVIAGAPVAPKAPVRWRGCSIDCLNFLDDPEPRDTEVGDDEAVFLAGVGANGEEFNFSSDEED